MSFVGSSLLPGFDEAQNKARDKAYADRNGLIGRDRHLVVDVRLGIGCTLVNPDIGSNGICA